MANGVQVDDEGLDKFIRQMSAFNRELEQKASGLNAQFAQLGDTWKDPGYVKFETEFRQTMTNLKRFKAICDEITPKLNKQVQAIRELKRIQGRGG